MNLSLALQTVVDDDDGWNIGIGASGVVGLLVVVLLVLLIVLVARGRV